LAGHSVHSVSVIFTWWLWWHLPIMAGRQTAWERIARYPEPEAHIIEAHPWDNPEVSFSGSAAYLDRVSRATL
jgi:hypothetical protein